MLSRFCDEETEASVRSALKSSVNIGIAGHVHPDGDAVGSCLGLARYIEIVNPAAQVTVYLGEFSPDFMFLEGADRVVSDYSADTHHDLFVSLDSSEAVRLGDAYKYFETADYTICLDHHITNKGYADINVISENASSTCELVASIIELEYADKELAECLYLGIVHDTGVFKHSCTSESTMDYAGRMIALGARSDFIIDQTFYKMTFAQNRALGHVLLNARLYFGGRLIIGSISAEQEREYGVKPSELGVVIDKLRVTEGVCVAAFIYWMDVEKEWSVSLRANGSADVSEIAASHGGGGHIKAAGYKSGKPFDELVEEIIAAAEKQLY